VQGSSHTSTPGASDADELRGSRLGAALIRSLEWVSSCVRGGSLAALELAERGGLSTRVFQPAALAGLTSDCTPTLGGVAVMLGLRKLGRMLLARHS
jgi:hypothetical protein